MVKKTSIAVALGLSLLLVSGAAWAQAVLHVGDPPNEGTYFLGDEVRPISGTSLGILENGEGQPAITDLYLIVGIPDQGSVGPAITSQGGVVGSYEGAFDSGEVYDFAGFDGPVNRSNNFGNWAEAAAVVLGSEPSFFGITVYGLGNTGLTGGEIVNVTFGDALPLGSIAIAYGTGSGPFSTPFTESGMVPEPGTVMLLGSGLLGLVLYRRKFQA